MLIAGTENDLAIIETLLATLPANARGQVFVEVEHDDMVMVFCAPGRVMVSWLVRDRGQNLTRSLDAWLSEMLPVDLHQHSVYAWIASEGAARTLVSD